MKKQVIFTVVLVLIGAFSVFLGVVVFGSAKSVQKQEIQNEERETSPSIFSFLNPDEETEKGIQKSLTEKSKQILSVWAALKIINGVINVLQSAQVGAVVASVNPFEFLAPVDNVLDKISNMLLWALGAIIFEKILLAISGYIVFTFIIPVCALVSIITVWTYKDKTKVHKIIIVALLISLIVPFVIPISFLVSTLVEERFLTNRVNTLISSLNEKEQSAESMRDTLTVRNIGRTITTYLSNAKNIGEAMIEDMINYFIMFIITCIFIPIFSVFGIYKLTKYSVKLILGK